MLPFKALGGKKTAFVFFPKYVARFEVPVSEIESALEKINLTRGAVENIYVKIFMKLGLLLK